MDNLKNNPTEKTPIDLTRVYVNNVSSKDSYSVGGKINKTKKQINRKNNNNVNKKESNKNVNVITDVFQLEEDKKEIKNILKVKPKKANSNLKVMFLGGVGEIGKNMMVLEYANDIIIIDCGATFPSDDMPGIDLVVPDISYLKANADKIKGIVLTHGHEDHIGAIPYVLNEIHTTIYGSRLSLGLVENKLKEYPKIKAKFVSVKPKQTINLGCFTIEFMHVNHSIPGAMALAINTPVGLMVHTGDFKIDFESMDGHVTDLSRFAELGRKGVLLLTCESTNVEKDGYSMSEKRVAQALDVLFQKYLDKRLFIASFASNVLRLQQFLDLAEKYNRKVVFTGRSMLNVAETAYKIGELKFNKNNILDIDKISGYKDSELDTICESRIFNNSFSLSPKLSFNATTMGLSLFN